MRVGTLVVLGMLLGAGVAWVEGAQQPTLAEVARQEAARRKALEGSHGSKVYTNKDLPKDAQVKADAPAAKGEAGEDTASKDGDAKKGTGAEGAHAGEDKAQAGADKAAGAPAADAASDDPRVNELRGRLQDAIDQSKVLLTEMDHDALTIVNLYNDDERKGAIAKRDARMAEFRKVQAQIQALTEQLNEARAEAEQRKKEKSR